MSKVPVCREHMSLVWKELKTSKANNKLGLAAVWLDNAKCLWLQPRQADFFALERYGIDPKLDDPLKSY